MGKFWKVGPFWDQIMADVDINTKNSISNSGSNGTMQNVLAILAIWLSVIRTTMSSATPSASIFELF